MNSKFEDMRQIKDEVNTVLLLILIYLMHYLSIYFPTARLWGFNHLLFLPDVYIYIFAAASIPALLMFISPVRPMGEKLFESVSALFLNHPGHRRWLVISLAALPIFWFLRMPTNMLGDGYSVIHNIGDNLPVVFKWTEMGAIRVVYFISQLIPVEGLKKGEITYALISVCSGSVTVFFFISLAYELGASGYHRFFILCLLVFSGWMLLFFGYAENYPILWPVMVGYVYFSVRYLKDKGNLVIPTILAIMAVMLHLQAPFFVVSYLFLLSARGRGHRFCMNHKKPLWMFFGMLAAVGGMIFVMKYQTSIPFRIHILPPMTGRPITPDYALLSVPHLLDIISEMNLLLPLWPVLLFLGWRNFRSIIKDGIARFLLIFSAGGILFLIFIDPRLGMGRDWDLFALAGLGPTLLVARTVASSDKYRKLYPGLAVLSLVLIFPFFATNLSYQPSIEYMKWLLRLDLPKSKPGFVILRDYYDNIGKHSVADSLNNIIVDTYPMAWMGPMVSNMCKAGRLDEALAIADSMVRADPYSKEHYNMRGMVYRYMSEYKKAKADYEMSIRIEPYDNRPMINLAGAYYGMKEYDEMMKYVRRAQALNPNGSNVLQALTTAFITLKVYDSSLMYAQKLLQVDSTEINGFFALGMSYYKLGDVEKGRMYLNRFLGLSPRNSYYMAAQKILEEIDKEQQ